ncbi:MAG: GNAT family N-acetyltransferase [Candidatus Rickettsia vulgarisii]
MQISFTPLNEAHFPLLLKWLETPHVKAWWDKDINWTTELINKKYSNYVKGYKVLTLKDQTITKPMYSFIICADNQPIGYIQYYNKHDFPPEQNYNTSELPESCAGLDWYIGELEFTSQGIGPKALSLFLEKFVFPKFTYTFVDSETINHGAIRAYEKAGFTTIKKTNNNEITWMLKVKS